MDAYREARRLYAEAMLSKASGQVRIDELEQTLQWIGELVPQAAQRDRPAVLLLNSSIVELIALESDKR